MSSQIIGFSFGLMSMVLYGLYMVPRKQSPVSQGVFVFWMGWGIFLGTAVIGLLGEGRLPRVTISQYLIMLACGIVWATGTLAYCSAVKYIGLARSTPIKNTSAMLGTLIGLLLFREIAFTRPASLIMAVLGSLAVVTSATLLGKVEAFDDVRQEEGSPHMLYGVLAAVWAAIAYSAYTIPMKMVYAQGISPSAFLLYMGQGCFIGMVMLSLVLKPGADKERVSWHDRRLALLSGLMWAAGSFCANSAIKLVGVAVAWPLTKNTVIAVLYGVLILKEIDTTKHRRDLTLGLALSVLGIVLLALV